MKKNRKGFSFVLAAIMIISIGTSMVGASAEVNHNYTEATATVAYQFRNLPVNKAVQSFYMVSDNEIFVTQRYGTSTYLSRCILLADQNEDPTFRYCVDYAVLTDYGHGESLEVDTSVPGKTYIWVGSNPDTMISPYWSREVSRILYAKTTNTTTTALQTSVSDKRSLTTMLKARADGKELKSDFSVKRVSVGIADGNDRIGFRVQLSDDTVYYSIYDLSDINAYLGKHTATAMDNSMIRSYCKSTFQCTVLPNGSYQGHDMMGVGDNNRFIFIAGVNAGETPKISRILYTNNTKGKVWGNYTYQSDTTIEAPEVDGYEIEQVRIWRNNAYFAINLADGDEWNSTIVYRIPVPAA